MSKEVSILIPTKNRPLLLERLLTSIKQQSFLSSNKIRCHIVDSSNNFETKNLVNKWIVNKHKNLFIDYEFNSNETNPIDNWLLLVSKITTDYSKFMCDDDWLESNALSEFAKYMEPKVNCIVSNINLCFSESSKNVSDYYDLKTSIVDPNNVLNSFLGLKSSIPVTQSASYFRSDALIESFNFSFKNLHCTNRLFGEDLTLNYYHSFKDHSSIHLNKSLVNSWAGSDSLTLNSNLSVITYCNVLSLCLLVDEFNFLLNKNQKKAIQHYLFSNRLKRIFNKDYGDIKYAGKLKPVPSIKKLYQFTKKLF